MHTQHCEEFCSLYYTGGVAVKESYFGKGSVDVFFSQFDCSDSETQLNKCPFYEGPSQLCSTHNNDAGVICTGICMLPCI